MFSNRIANSARFLQMPAETQLLYFHFILRADDDGIVESYPVIKLLGVPADNFKILIAKGLIKQLNEDQVIVITDWLEHNQIRPDRKVNSIYLPLLKEKYPELPIIEPKPRADTGKTTGGQPMDDHSPLKLSKVKVSKVKLSEDKLSEVNISKEIDKSTSYGNEDINKVFSFLKEKLGGSPDGSARDNRRFAKLLLDRMKKDYPEKSNVEQIEALIEFGLKDKFHGQNITSFKYLYYNCQKIILSVKGQINNPKFIQL